jgi:clostripain
MVINIKQTKFIFLLLSLCFPLDACLSMTAPKADGWTILYYAVGSNSSETDLLSDVQEMMDGKIAGGYRLVLLIDRVAGYSEDSTTLGENFADTRLYEIDKKTYTELDGRDLLPELRIGRNDELNMADAHLLKQFIRYGKSYYPADHYLLIMRSHGNGMAMCPDGESGTMDRIYPGEIADVLTSDESVDILGLDVCSMAGLENLYEWRPGTKSFSANYIIASAPLSGAWAYDEILQRLQPVNSPEIDRHVDPELKTWNPRDISPLDFANLLFEEIQDNQTWSSWGLFDNTKIEDIKNSIDDLARSLALEDKSEVKKLIEKTLGYYHNISYNPEAAQLTAPYIDAGHFYDLISRNEAFQPITKLKASKVCVSLDDLVIRSFYGEGFLPSTKDFVSDKNGVYQIIPLGDHIYGPTGRTFWSHSTWFHPYDQASQENAYGSYDWCKDGAEPGNNQVDNFYEYLDFLFDDHNLDSGGVNNYQW